MQSLVHVTLPHFPKPLTKLGTSQEWSRRSSRHEFPEDQWMSKHGPSRKKQTHKSELFEPQTEHSPKLSHQRQCRCNPTTLDHSWHGGTAAKQVSTKVGCNSAPFTLKIKFNQGPYKLKYISHNCLVMMIC